MVGWRWSFLLPLLATLGTRVPYHQTLLHAYGENLDNGGQALAFMQVPNDERKDKFALDEERAIDLSMAAVKALPSNHQHPDIQPIASPSLLISPSTRSLKTLVSSNFSPPDPSLSSSCSSDNNCTGPFECYLASLVIDINNVTFTVNNDTIQVIIVELVCDCITLTEATFAFLAPYQLDQAIGGLGLHCSGHFEWQDSAHPNKEPGKGNVTVVVEEGAVELSYDILPSAHSVDNNGTIPVPHSAKTISCMAHLNISDLDFGGPSALDELLEFFAPAFAAALETAIPFALCVELSKAIDEGLSEVLALFDDALQPLLVSPIS